MSRNSPNSLKSAIVCKRGWTERGRLALQVAAEADVVPAVGLGLEPQRYVEQRTDAARHAARARGRRVDAGQQLQQRALAGAVVADDADALALFHRQVDRVRGP